MELYEANPSTQINIPLEGTNTYYYGDTPRELTATVGQNGIPTILAPYQDQQDRLTWSVVVDDTQIGIATVNNWFLKSVMSSRQGDFVTRFQKSVQTDGRAIYGSVHTKVGENPFFSATFIFSQNSGALQRVDASQNTYKDDGLTVTLYDPATTIQTECAFNVDGSIRQLRVTRPEKREVIEEWDIETESDIVFSKLRVSEAAQDQTFQDIEQQDIVKRRLTNTFGIDFTGPNMPLLDVKETYHAVASAVSENDFVDIRTLLKFVTVN
jgi:hypothetical protein